MDTNGTAVRKLLLICSGVVKNGAPSDPSLYPRHSYPGG